MTNEKRDEKINQVREMLGYLETEKNLSLTDIASKLGLSYWTVYCWKSGRRAPKPPTIQALKLMMIEA